MNLPAVPLSVCFLAGVWLGVYSSDLPSISVSLFLVGAAGCLALAATALYFQSRGVATFLLLGAFFWLGASARSLDLRKDSTVAALAADARWSHTLLDAPVRVSGRLRREPEHQRDTTRFDLDAEELRIGRRHFRVTAGVRLGVSGDLRGRLARYRSGDRIRVWATLRRPSSFHNPGGFDFTRYLARRDVVLVGSVKSGLLVEQVERARAFAAMVSTLRKASVARIERAFVDVPGAVPNTVGVVVALVTGERSGLPASTERAFQRAGIFHVMAISGAHVAIWVLFTRAFLLRLGISQRWVRIVILGLLPLYAVFCGGRAPVVRAAVMAGFVVTARLVGLQSRVLNAVSLAAIAILAARPAELEDAGFQLSFAAMTSIGALYAPLRERLRGLGFLAAPVAVAAAAQLGVVPVAAWHFHRVNPLAPVLGLPAVPIAGVVCVLGVVLVLSFGIPVVSSLVALSLHALVSALTALAELVARMPGVSIRVGRPALVVILVYLGCLLLWNALASGRRHPRTRIVVLGGLSVLMLAGPWWPPRERGVLTASFLDVGHGDAILLSLPGGEHVLVDGGGLPRSTMDIGESVVVPFLLDHGVRRLRAVVSSHPDFDHIGGLRTVVEELGVDELWEGPPDWNREAYRALRAKATALDIPVRTLGARERFEISGARFEVLAAGDPSARSSNDRSVVLRVSYAGRSLLLTGDAEAELEARLVSSGTSLRSDVLKLSHHGSASSSSAAFLDAVEPRFAVLSTREVRHRPIPSPIVIERLERRDIEYRRTDRSGTITVRIDPDGAIGWSTFR